MKPAIRPPFEQLSKPRSPQRPGRDFNLLDHQQLRCRKENCVLFTVIPAKIVLAKAGSGNPINGRSKPSWFRHYHPPPTAGMIIASKQSRCQPRMIPPLFQYKNPGKFSTYNNAPSPHSVKRNLPNSISKRHTGMSGFSSS